MALRVPAQWRKLTPLVVEGSSSWPSPAGSGRTYLWPAPSPPPEPSAPCRRKTTDEEDQLSASEILSRGEPETVSKADYNRLLQAPADAKRNEATAALHLLHSVSCFIATWWPSVRRSYQTVKVITSNFELFLSLKQINLENTASGHFGLWAADVASCLQDMPGSTPSPLHLREAWAAAITTQGFLFLFAVTQICSSPCLPFAPLPLPQLSAECLDCVSLTSSHLWRGCRGCSFRRRPAAGGRLRWHGDSPTLSGRCTGWPCQTWQAKDKLLFFIYFCF